MDGFLVTMMIIVLLIVIWIAYTVLNISDQMLMSKTELDSLSTWIKTYFASRNPVYMTSEPNTRLSNYLIESMNAIKGDLRFITSQLHASSSPSKDSDLVNIKIKQEKLLSALDQSFAEVREALELILQLTVPEYSSEQESTETSHASQNLPHTTQHSS